MVELNSFSNQSKVNLSINRLNRQNLLSTLIIQRDHFILIINTLLYFEQYHKSINNTYLMRVPFRLCGGETHFVECEPSDAIRTLKDRIASILGDQQFRMLYEGDHLRDEDLSLLDYKYEQGSVIQLLREMYGGGGFQCFKFNDLSLPTTRNFRDSAPKWRVIGSGLNLEGVCKNMQCQAFLKQVWIRKGFGKFNMSEEVYKSQCPICKHYCEEVENMGLFMGRCLSKGRMKGQAKEKEIISIHNNYDNFLTYNEREEGSATWLYLTMQVVPL